MKLLIITQSVDKNNPVLGFFVRWVEEFSKKCEKTIVVCLEKGEYSLPGHVRVLSLGKESNSKCSILNYKLFKDIAYIFKFYRYIWRERQNYDAVFVHMNQEYVLLGGIFWKLMGKKIMLWRNHPRGSFLTNFAVFLSNRVFCTSRYSYTARFKKTEIMPVGIDTDFFRRKPEIKKIPNSILFLGRISSIKKPDLFVEALNLLNKEGMDFNALIAGSPLLKDREYYDGIKLKVKEYGLENKVNFVGSIKNEETVDLYNKYEIYVNLTPSGSMDKTIFEAMACESLVLVVNKSLEGAIEKEFVVSNEDGRDMVIQIKNLLLLDSEVKKKKEEKLRNFVIGDHSLKRLAYKIFN